MWDYFIGILRGRFREAKKQNILGLIILVLVARLFFSILFDEKAFAKEEVFHKNYNNIVGSIDPLDKIGKGIFPGDNGKKYTSKIKKDNPKKKESTEAAIYTEMVNGHPIEEMISEISKQDKKVAAFLISIAKKESNWGKHSPKKNGKDCYNYWGYRGKYNATDSGYSCFDNPEQAVKVVGERIEDLIGQEINTPEKMIVWKCGRSCSWDNPASVQKWISDVGLYYYKLNS